MPGGSPPGTGSGAGLGNFQPALLGSIHPAATGLREILKLIPIAGTWLGGALNATAAFSVTYGLGEAACVWLGHRRLGRRAPDEEVRRAFAEGLAEGLRRRGRQPGAAA